MKTMMAVVGLMAMVLGALGQGNVQTLNVPVPSTLQNLTNTTVTSTSGTAVALPVQDPGVDLGVWVSIVAAGNSRSNTTVGLELSPDNVIWTGTHPIQVVVAANDTSTNVGYAVLTRTNWVGAKWVRAGYVTSTCITNHTVSSVTLSWTK